jgi:hypothetical protein
MEHESFHSLDGPSRYPQLALRHLLRGQAVMIADRTKDGARMNIFKTFMLKWWQTGLFKLGMLALGIAIGAYWHDFFGGYLLILIAVAAVSLAYVTYLWWKQ